MSRVRAVVLVTVLAASVAAGCTRVADVPRPTHTLEPAPTPTTAPAKHHTDQTACSLLNVQERGELAGVPMNQVIPANPLEQRSRCEWAHSLPEAATRVVSVEALDARVWALRTRGDVVNATHTSNVPKSRVTQLRRAARDLLKGKPSRTRACDIYWLLVSLGSNDFEKGDQVVFPQYLGPGQLPRVISTSCEDGVYTAVTFAQYRLYPTPTLGDRVVAARKAAEKRAIERLGPQAKSTPTPTATPTTKRRP